MDNQQWQPQQQYGQPQEGQPQWGQQEPAVLCAAPTISTTTMGNAATLSTNGDAKRLVNYSPVMFICRHIWGTSFLYWPHRNRLDPTLYFWRLWHLVAN